MTAGALGYNISLALFGGTGPMIGVWLNHNTGSSYGFAIYLAALCVITVITAYVARAIFERSDDSDTDTADPAAGVLEVR